MGPSASSAHHDSRLRGFGRDETHRDHEVRGGASRGAEGFEGLKAERARRLLHFFFRDIAFGHVQKGFRSIFFKVIFVFSFGLVSDLHSFCTSALHFPGSLLYGPGSNSVFGSGAKAEAVLSGWVSLVRVGPLSSKWHIPRVVICSMEFEVGLGAHSHRPAGVVRVAVRFLIVAHRDLNN